MGQKVHPYGFRLGFNKTWRSRWFSDRDYAKLLHEDLEPRAPINLRQRERVDRSRVRHSLLYYSANAAILGRLDQ